MKITIALVNKLIRLRDGEWLPASQLKGDWVNEMEREGVIISKSMGSHRLLHVVEAGSFCRELASIDHRLANLDDMRDFMQSEGICRSKQAVTTGNSKLVTTRSCPGFPVNSLQPIVCCLNGKEFVVDPQEGSFLFVTDWDTFSIPSNVVVVGVENMENFRMIRAQQTLFEQAIGREPLIFVSRYPQSGDLHKWLMKIPNRYVHFGDFDLAGISIFLTEFHVHLHERSSFLIPEDIEARLKNGSFERYQNQYQRFRNLQTGIAPLQRLIDRINTYHRCYDQEGYISR